MGVDPTAGEDGQALSKQQALIKFGKYLLHFRAEGRKGNLISYT